MRDAIISLAAGAGQVPLLRAARDRGYAVVAVDRALDAPGLVLADVAIQASTHDAEEIRRGLAGIGDDLAIRAVVTQSSGVPVATTARLAHELGLRGLDPTAAAQAVTKAGTMQLAAHAGVPVPRSIAVEAVAEIADRGFAPPLVLKPSLTVVGKAGVSLVRDAAELDERFGEARAASADGVVEVEEYLDGCDVAVLGLFDSDGFQTLAVLDEDTRFDGDGRARGYGFSLPASIVGTDLEGEAIGRAAGFVEALDLGVGYGAFTFRVGAEGTAKLIEVHLDFAGDFVLDRLVPTATGLDVIGAAVDHLVGDGAMPPRPTARPTALRFVYQGDLANDREAKVAALNGLGDGFETDLDIPATGDGAVRRVGVVLVRAETAEDLARRIAEVDRSLGRK